MYRTRILSTGGYLPEKIVTNEDMTQYIETSHQWIVPYRDLPAPFCSGGEYTSDLATAAAQVAMKRAGVKPADIDLIIVATATPTIFFPQQQSKCSVN